MPVTQEPRGLVWINNINTNAFGSLTSQVCWLVGSLVLTLADYQLLREDTELERQAGIFLAGILVTAWTGKTVAGVFDSDNKRKANPAYVPVLEAKERAAKAAAQATALAKEAARDAQALRENGVHRNTAERDALREPPTPAVHIDNAENVETVVGASGPARARPTGDARVDDESGS